MPGRRRIPALAAACALALALTGCGAGEDPDLPQEQADQMLAALDGVESSVAAGDCELAAAQVDNFTVAVNALPEEVGFETKEALREAAAQTEELALAECAPEEPAPTETTTDTSTTDTTTTTEEEETTTDEEPTTDDGPPTDTPGQGTPPEDPGHDGGPEVGGEGEIDDDPASGGVTP